MGAALMRRIAAATLSLSCAYWESTIRTPSGPASTPILPPAASSCDGSRPPEPDSMYRFGAIWSVMIWTLSKSICWAKPFVASDAAVKPAASSHAGFIVVAPFVPDASGMLSEHSPDRRRSVLGLTLRQHKSARTGEGHCPPHRSRGGRAQLSPRRVGELIHAALERVVEGERLAVGERQELHQDHAGD